MANSLLSRTRTRTFTRTLHSLTAKKFKKTLPTVVLTVKKSMIPAEIAIWLSREEENEQ